MNFITEISLMLATFMYGE